MRAIKTVLPLILGLALAPLALDPAALAQEAADPIGALLLQIPQSPEQDAQEPDTGGQPVRIEPDPKLPPGPIPYSALPATPARAPAPYVAPYTPTPRGPAAYPRPRVTEPVDLMEVGKTPEAPPTVNALAYDSRLRSSFASAQSFQGPLDGTWTLSDGQRPIYTLQLVDRGKGVLEGVWRDLRLSGTPDASGFVDEIGRGSGGLTMQFAGVGGQVSLRLSGGHAGVWQGQLTERGGARAVTMRKAR